MQFRKISYLLLLYLLFLAQNLSSQELRKNEKGERIIVYPDGRWEYFDAAKNKSAQNRSTKDLKYPTFSPDVLPLKNPISLSEEDARKIALRHAQLAKEASTIAQKRAQEARDNREKLENLIATKIDVEGQDQLTKRLEIAKLTERRTVKEAMLAIQEFENAEKIIQEGSFNKPLEDQTNAKEAWELPAAKSFANVDQFYNYLPSLESPFEYKQLNNKLSYSKRNCVFDYEGIDKLNGQYRRDLEKEFLFNYTDNRLRMYLKDKDYLKCEAFMTSLGGGFRLLSLQFSFAYPNAREAYGFIEKGSTLIIKLLNGGFIQLRSGKMDKGHYDTEKELLTYEVHYSIGPSFLNSLKTSEIDTIIVSWSSGYEEYQVYNLDFFQRQINCLEK